MPTKPRFNYVRRQDKHVVIISSIPTSPPSIFQTVTFWLDFMQTSASGKYLPICFLCGAWIS